MIEFELHFNLFSIVEYVLSLSIVCVQKGQLKISQVNDLRINLFSTVEMELDFNLCLSMHWSRVQPKLVFNYWNQWI